jgi:putative ABC transport system permease protein
MRPLLGRVFDPRETEPGSPPLVMLGHSIWRSDFAGDSSVVGTSITLDGAPPTVIGLLPRESTRGA